MAELNTDPRRRAELAKIAIARKALGIDETTYRLEVERISGGRTRSAADLSGAERNRLLGEYQRAGWRPTRPNGGRSGAPGSGPGQALTASQRPARRGGAPTAERAALAGKLRALLADAQRPDAYADAIARKRWGIERWEWLGWADLKALVQMLAIDQRRRQARGTAPAPDRGS